MYQADGTRIDYVRLRLPSDGLDKAEAAADWTAQIDHIIQKLGIDRKCYGFDMYYDYHLKRKIPYFQVWGEASDAFFNTLTTGDMRRLMRLDYRRLIAGDIKDWDQLFFMLKRRNKGKIATKMHTANKRSKEGGRDTGGDYVAMGAEGSQRRVSLYERAAEGPVWEFQCVGAALKSVLSQALVAGDLRIAEATDLVRAALEHEATAYFVKYTGFQPAQLDEGLPTQQGIVDYTDPEEVASQLDLFWEIAPAEVREAFLEAHTTMTEHAVARAVDAELFLNEGDWEETDNEVVTEDLPEPVDFGNGWYTGDEPA